MAKPILHINGEAMDMGSLPSITLERHNPLLSEGQQSYSYPFLLPSTPHNDRLLDLPRRYTRSAMGKKQWRCTMRYGAHVLVGVLHLNNMDATHYDCNLVCDTAELLSSTKGKKLSELLEDRAYRYGSAAIAVSEMQRIYSGAAQSEMFSVFPVLLDSGMYGDDTATLEDEGNVWHNMLNYVRDGALVDARQELANGVLTSTMRGYGVAPFFRVLYLLQLIFEEKEGHTLDFGNRAANPMEKLVVLHNRADVLIHGNLQYKHLCPDCTVDELIATLEGMFCGRFTLNGKTGTVTFRYFNDLLDSGNQRGMPAAPFPPYPDTRLNGTYKQPALNLMPYSLAPPAVEPIPRRAIKLRMQKNASQEIPKTMLPHDFSHLLLATFEEFFSQKVYADFERVVAFGAGSKSAPYEDLAKGLMVHNNEYGMGLPYFSSYCSGNAWDYYRGVTGGASLDVDLACEHLSCFSGKVSDGANDHPQSAVVYRFGSAHVNSAPPEGSSDTEQKTPLAFACEYLSTDYGRIGVINGGASYAAANAVPSLRLHRANGLFIVYHSLRNAMLSGGGYRLSLPVDPAVHVDENELYTLSGQRVVVEKVVETLGEDARQEVYLQTVKQYS